MILEKYKIILKTTLEQTERCLAGKTWKSCSSWNNLFLDEQCYFRLIFRKKMKC